ncbi:MAG: FAD-dependent thymidylate synthase [Thermoguttaceae bacterium]
MVLDTDSLCGLRWEKLSVLDDGFVCLVDMMGDDAAIAQAARVSYGAGTRAVSDDRALIRYLMRHRHTTPFEMVELKFLVRVPMDCWRQWIRHRTASVNEYSTRYSVAVDSAYTTAPDAWRLQATSNRQGSDGTLSLELGEHFTRDERDFHNIASKLYKTRLDAGIAREQARKDLPLSTYTEAYWKIDLHNLLHFLELRMDVHAQHEIRSYAATIGERIVRAVLPLTWEAFLDYRAGGIHLTRLDQGVIARLAASGHVPATEEQFLACQDVAWRDQDRSRERDECREKLTLLGIVRS